MFSSSILSSVHAVETPLPEGPEIACGNPLCSATFKPGGVASSPKRFCRDPCKQQLRFFAERRPCSSISVKIGRGASWRRSARVNYYVLAYL
jgi:hypothetical protein